MSPDLTVIIVTYNSAAVLPRCLQSVANSLESAEIIVVDNGSSDDTVRWASAQPGVRILEGHGNVGYGAAANLGAAAANRELLLIMNPDVTVARVDLGELDRLTRAPNVGLRACRRIGRRGTRGVIFSAWSWPTEMNWWMFSWFLLPNGLPMPRPRPRAGQPRWINGSAFVSRRREFVALGGFDERFFLYVEDFALSGEYRSRGLPVTTTDAIFVAHTAGTSSPRAEEGMIAYALLGLIEVAAHMEGEPGATRAAERTLRWLRRLSQTGRALRRWPVLGRRASKKARSAEGVRRRLEELAGAEATHTYPAARRAVALTAARSARP